MIKIRFLPFLALNFALFSQPIVAADMTSLNKLGEVARAQFTTAVENREPVDQVVVLSNDINELYYFTDLRYMSGQTVTYQWEYNGHVEYKSQTEVNGPRWRAYSKITLNPNKLGKWTVLVTDSTGWPLKASMFEYVEASTSPVPANATPETPATIQ